MPTTPPRGPSSIAHGKEPSPRSPAENLYRPVPNALATLLGYGDEDDEERDRGDDGASRRARAASRAHTAAVALVTMTTWVDTEAARTALSPRLRACSSATGSTRVGQSSSTRWMRSAQQHITCIWNALARMSQSIPERCKISAISLADQRPLPAQWHSRRVAAELEHRARRLSRRGCRTPCFAPELSAAPTETCAQSLECAWFGTFHPILLVMMLHACALQPAALPHSTSGGRCAPCPARMYCAGSRCYGRGHARGLCRARARRRQLPQPVARARSCQRVARQAPPGQTRQSRGRIPRGRATPGRCGAAASAEGRPRLRAPSRAPPRRAPAHALRASPSARRQRAQGAESVGTSRDAGGRRRRPRRCAGRGATSGETGASHQTHRA